MIFSILCLCSGIRFTVHDLLNNPFHTQASLPLPSLPHLLEVLLQEGDQGKHQSAVHQDVEAVVVVDELEEGVDHPVVEVEKGRLPADEDIDK